MERTAEFTRITQLFSDAPIIMAKHRPLSKFARVAQQISDAISQTESLLKELSNLVTKKHITVEDDPTKQISDIVDIVKQSIPPMLKDIEIFEGAVAGEKQQQKHFYIVCSSLKMRMSNCGKALQVHAIPILSPPLPDQRCHDMSVAFQEGMQNRATVIKKQSERRTKFGFTGQAPSVQISTPLTIRNKLQTAAVPAVPPAPAPVLPNHNQPLHHPEQSPHPSGATAPLQSDAPGDYQPAAFSITSAANDVAAVISSLGETSAYVYGVSYGTAVVSRVMHFSPSVVRGFILDGVQSEAFPTWIDAPTFTNWDRDFSDVARRVADRFLDLCHDDAFCRSKFSTLRGTLQVLYADLDSGKHNCTAFVKSLGNDDIAPSNILRALFGSFFPDMAMRLLVPVFIYRLRRCTANDMDVMTFALIRVYGDSEGGGGGDPPDVDAPDSSMLYKTIVFSELWQRPSPGLMDLYQVFANSTMSSGIYSQVLEYCLFAGVVAAEQSCVDLGTMLPTTASATNFTYTPDTYFNVTATIPPHTSVLVLSGKLDPQTPHKYAEDQFQRMAGTAKRMFAFEYAAHGTIATTPVITPNHPTCAVSLILSYVQNQGNLDAIDTSCVARVQPLVFEWTSTAAKDAFNVTDAYDGIVGEDAPRPKPTTAAPTERPDNTQTSYLTGVVVACVLLGVLSITLVVLLRMLHQLARRDTVSNIAVQA
ncbi:hypothetical protein DYB32_005510 [Aphanomyces invadans]|uniref:Peptidase S33 tripeptidyl aminopeptidase-like C-terminal domain-containing protein n=1 Tax=Aphanomyces invadans TaxID=157072 RepID=A0A3R6ZPG0_9STRA|nr:hypothetical protein DYB32_005510 [Aphanomyces invadans]